MLKTAKNKATRIFLYGLGMLLFLASVAYAKEGQVVLKFALYTPPTHTYFGPCQKIAPLFEKCTGGEVKVKLFHSGTLGSQRDMFNVIQNGVADIGLAVNLLLCRGISFFEVDTTPGLWTDTKSVLKAWDQGLQDIQEKMYRENGYSNVKVVGNFAAGMRYLATKNKQVKRFEDLKGMKIRTVGKNEARLVELAGGSSVYIPVSETYEALERGIIDGLINTDSALKDWKQMEPCEYLLDFPIDQVTLTVIMNKNSYEKIPAKYKAVVDVLLNYLVYMLRYESLSNELNAHNTVIPKYVVYYKPNEKEKKSWKFASETVMDEWLKRSKTDGEKAIEIIKIHNK